MPFPRSFSDDGQVVILDVHGCTVDDAMFLIRAVSRAAFDHGRARVDVVHGYSTSVSEYERTIKNVLGGALASGDLASWVSGASWDEAGGRCALWINVGGGTRRGRISISSLV